MPELREPISSSADESFRKGACHAAEWFLETVRTLAEQGRTSTEVAEHLTDLAALLSDWRTYGGELPEGNPWDWSFKDLASAIRERKRERE
jgi:hypothetical protein